MAITQTVLNQYHRGRIFIVADLPSDLTGLTPQVSVNGGPWTDRMTTPLRSSGMGLYYCIPRPEIMNNVGDVFVAVNGKILGHVYITAQPVDYEQFENTPEIRGEDDDGIYSLTLTPGESRINFRLAFLGPQGNVILYDEDVSSYEELLRASGTAWFRQGEMLFFKGPSQIVMVRVTQ